jgi:hypothetical protein
MSLEAIYVENVALSDGQDIEKPNGIEKENDWFRKAAPLGSAA